MRKLFLLLLLPCLAIAQQQIINTGTGANTGTGDPLRTAFGKVNSNFNQVFTPLNRTPAEILAGVTPTNYGYAPGNALRYGCDPSGVASSSPCLKDLVAVLAAAGGGTGIIPSGTYLANGITITNDSVFLQGAGSSATFIRNTGASTPVFTFGDNVSQRFRGGLSGITFSGNSAVTGVDGQTAFTFQKVGQFTVSDVFVTNFPTALYRGAYFLNSSQFVVFNLRVQATTLDGITNIGGIDAYVTDSRSDGNGGSGWVLNASQGGFYKSDTAYNNTANGWNLTSTTPASQVNFNNFFIGCVSDTSGSHNWRINDSRNSYFVNSWGASQQSTIVNTTAAGFEIASQYSGDLYFTGGQALNNNGHGVEIHDTGSSAPFNITFTNFQFGSTSNGSNGNGRSGGTAYGLKIDGGSNHIRVNGGSFAGNPTGSFLNSGGSDFAVSNYPIGSTTAWSSPGVSIDNTGAATLTSTWTFSPVGGNAIVANGVNGSYAARIIGNATTGGSKGLWILAGTNSSDSAFQITNQDNSASYFNLFGDGGINVGGPTGGNQGVNTINSQGAFYVNGNKFVDSAATVLLRTYTVATLPACATGTKGGLAYVTDATAPTYGAALTGGGAVVIPVFCNGVAWTAH